jgi:CBS domain containing-hemolysin-like protein
VYYFPSTETLASIPVLLILNGFFVSAEYSLLSIRRSKIEEKAADGDPAALKVTQALDHLDRYIAGVQLGITCSTLALGWVGGPALAGLIFPLLWGLDVSDSGGFVTTICAAFAFLVIAFSHFLLAEQIPKSLGLQKPEETALILSRPLTFIISFFRPVIASLTVLSDMILELLGLRPPGSQQGVHSPEEIQILVHQSHQAGMLDDAERQIIQRTFRFSELTVGEIMTSRLDMFTLDISKSIEEILEEVAHISHTRLPVHEGNPDAILGIVHVQSVLKSLITEAKAVDVRALLQPALIVPENSHVGQLLMEFQEKRTQIALVVDEYGAITGLVTLQDIIEEVFGEMQESLAPDQRRISRDGDGSYVMKGEVRLDEIFETAGWNLKDDDVDTIAGYIMKQLGRVARVDDRLETPFGEIFVMAMVKRRITQVRLVPARTESDGD